MANVFKKYQNFVKKPNRNSFDLSFTNNFTTDFGRLTPVFCKEVLPGDSVRIDPTFGLNFAPMMYPVQTKMKAHLHFFYVRNRTLWKDWMDFIGNTKEGLIPPYIDFGANTHLLKSGSLADYLGLPTTLVKPTGVNNLIFGTYNPNRPNNVVTSKYTIPISNFLGIGEGASTSIFITDPTTQQQESNAQAFIQDTVVNHIDVDDTFNTSNILTIGMYASKDTPSTFTMKIFCIVPYLNQSGLYYYSPSGGLKAYYPNFNNFDVNTEDWAFNVRFTLQSTNENENYYTGTLNFAKPYYDYETSFTEWLKLLFAAPSTKKLAFFYKLDNDISGRIDSINIPYSLGTNEFIEANELSLRPYGADVLPISALPFRAYEAIYNSFYRNPQNNPFILDGKPEYNKYVTNIDGGLDQTYYDIYKRNWDDDAFTTAVQSPQQGIAPLVGVSASGEFTFQDDEGTYKAQAQFGEDGETITGISVENRMPAGTTRALIDLVSTGISINDFRNVNALQRWLEKNMRRGFRYKDQIMSHFGSNVEFDELLMPEFIGGVSNQVDVNRIINSAETELAPLGSYGGLAQSFGGTPNKISHYCDEHGFIIGILSVVPYANYSQLMPKMFTRNSVLDYYFPEFGNIGMQAITNRDLMPLQSYANNVTPKQVNADLVKTFGYQRPWWDYISSTDEVHGRFRTDFRDYLLNRVFANNPTLNPDFLTIDSKDLNDVFVVTDDDAPNTDKILGIIHFDFKKKTTIPEFGIPKLEVE